MQEVWKHLSEQGGRGWGFSEDFYMQTNVKKKKSRLRYLQQNTGLYSIKCNYIRVKFVCIALHVTIPDDLL